MQNFNKSQANNHLNQHDISRYLNQLSDICTIGLILKVLTTTSNSLPTIGSQHALMASSMSGDSSPAEMAVRYYCLWCMYYEFSLISIKQLLFWTSLSQDFSRINWFSVTSFYVQAYIYVASIKCQLLYQMHKTLNDWIQHEIIFLGEKGGGGSCNPD